LGMTLGRPVGIAFFAVSTGFYYMNLLFFLLEYAILKNNTYRAHTLYQITNILRNRSYERDGG